MDIRTLTVVYLVLIGAAVYCLPPITALYRRHQQRVPIILVWLFFGATGIGWLVALIWASSHVPDEQRYKVRVLQRGRL